MASARKSSLDLDSFSAPGLVPSKQNTFVNDAF